MRTTLFSLIIVGLAGCMSAASPHPQDFQPDAGDEYVKNTAVTLDREYWVIYADEDGKHYIFPRPDGDEAIAAECAASGPRAPVFSAAMLCEAAGSPAAVDRVNSLSRAEALEVSTFLHAQLKFQVTRDGGVKPHPLLSDQVDVCNTYRSAREGALEALCDRELGYVDAGARPDVSFGLTEQEAAALAPLLNDLYGIP